MDSALKFSPENLIKDWGHVQDWNENGDSAAPTGWVMVGTAGSVAKESTNIKYGNYSMKIISAATGTYAAEISLPEYTLYRGFTLKFGMWIKCNTASKARIYIDDGVTQTFSSYHTGGNDWEFLEVEKQISTSNTEVTFGAQNTNNAITAYFTNGVAVRGETIFTDLRDAKIYTRDQDTDITTSSDVSDYSVPRRDGAFVDDVKYRAKKFVLRIQTYGATISEARGYYDELVKQMWKGQKELYVTDDRIFDTILTELPKPQYGADFRVNFFDVRMLCPDGTERSLSKTRKKQSAGPSPTSFNLENLGNVITYPVISVIPTGVTLSSFLLDNLTTGERFSYNGSLGAGITLEVDCGKFTVKKNDVDDLENFVGDFVGLSPGTNYFQFAGGTNTLRIDWFDRWL